MTVDVSDHQLEQDIMNNLSKLRETWMDWNDYQKRTNCKVVSSEQVRDTSLALNIQQSVANDSSPKHFVSSVKSCKMEKKIIKRRKIVTSEHPKTLSKSEKEDAKELDMFCFVRQHRDEVKRFVLQNEKSQSNLWKQSLMELGVQAKRKSKVPFPIFLGMQRKQKKRRARLLSKNGSTARK
ncbi:hypothetical protein Gasu2_52120 [Galdieria sulphuraria]|uniref:Uncharacterized protein n=1 Tax=Galdieria sulphuraria TaxID=130081 RepID=M2XXR2_GALSU|nr:uncharacterized protein Gasu_42320 [Galdieria sulphuraria]EME28229.1 hypothetical protein Gasu_42320 [Galdieria sulphuraria]GJD11056.1 hypothetical protein Gasu2_52120 [Galdieria sulphuraria]|eukprot:XP_005704749.1 hypothetical protein Gasu_42320 [Galdieria sulphuraria]